MRSRNKALGRQLDPSSRVHVSLIYSFRLKTYAAWWPVRVETSVHGRDIPESLGRRTLCPEFKLEFKLPVTSRHSPQQGPGCRWKEAVHRGLSSFPLEKNSVAWEEANTGASASLPSLPASLSFSDGVSFSKTKSQRRSWWFQKATVSHLRLSWRVCAG